MISTRPSSLAPFLVVHGCTLDRAGRVILEHLDAGPGLLDLVVTFRCGAWAGVGGETRSGVDAVGVVYNAR